MSENVVGGYQLLNSIASGTTTQIWEVVPEGGSTEHYVMKLMLPSAFSDPENIRVLRHEAKVQAALDHPNIARLHEFKSSKNEAYIVMEYFRAPNIKAQIAGDRDGLHIRLRRLMESTCMALQHVHDKGWIHKDVKPDNVLANKAGEVKLIDFSLSVRQQSGLGKLLGGKSKTIQGTRTYIAPETILKKSATPQTDVYSLGVMFFEMLTGLAPFLGTSPNDLLRRHLAETPPEPSARNPNVTDELDRIVVRMLAKKPGNRPQTMNDVFAELRTVQFFKQEIGTGKSEEKVEKLGTRLDSREDADRTSRGETAPLRPQRKKPPKPQPVAAAQPSAAPQPAAPGSPQGFPPGPYPAGQFPPGQYPPGQYPPQPYPPGQYPPGQYPPQQYPPQQYPPQGYPPGMYPPQGYPPGYAPGQPVPVQPVPVQPMPGPPASAPAAQSTPPSGAAPAPRPTGPQPAPASTPKPVSNAPPVRRQPPPPPEEPVVDEDLPLMTDLPDIL